MYNYCNYCNYYNHCTGLYPLHQMVVTQLVMDPHNDLTTDTLWTCYTQDILCSLTNIINTFKGTSQGLKFVRRPFSITIYNWHSELKILNPKQH